MGVSKNRGTPKSSILIGFSIINHPFWGSIIFGNTHVASWCNYKLLQMPGEWLDAAEGRHCTATCAQEKKVIRVKLLGLVRVAAMKLLSWRAGWKTGRCKYMRKFLKILSVWYWWSHQKSDLIFTENERIRKTHPLRYNDAVGDEIAGFTFNEAGFWGAIFDVISWLVNQPTPNVPPQKYGFNKALLRETNGYKPLVRPYF